ncbi:MAG: CopD family protein [Ornithinimicrobium sp.]
MPTPAQSRSRTTVRLTALFRNLGAALTLAFVLVLALAAPALAHTDLDSTTPADGATIDGPVDEVSLTFTLPVTQLGDGVSIDGPDGKVPVEVSSAEEGVVWIAVPSEPLSSGTYTGQWSVAAQDGHPLSGEFTFDVDAGPAGASSSAEDTAESASDESAVVTSDPQDENDDDSVATGAAADTARDASGFAEVVARLASAAALWGGLVAGGALIFASTVLKGSDRADMPVIATAIRWSAALILIALVVRVMARAVLISQGDITAAISPTAISDSLGDTTRWVLGLQAVGALTVLLATRPMLVRPWIIAVGVIALGAGHILAGHSNTVEPRWIVLAADIAHLVAAAVWVGGVVMIGMLLRHRRRHGQPLNAAAIGARFSVIAAAAVTVVGVAGVVLAITILDRPQELWLTSWGLFLLAKMAVVAVAAAIGAYNHFRVVPALAEPARHESPVGGASELLRRSATHETGIMLVIVLLTAWLVAASATP